MLQKFQDAGALYDYVFPPESIAQAPATPRDSAKLLVCRRSSAAAEWSTVRQLPALLPRGSLLVLNDTKVIPARLSVRRATGGRVALLWLRTENGHAAFLANKALRAGELLTLTARGRFLVERRSGKEWILRPNFPLRHLPKILEKHGAMPLPPYIKRTPLSERQRRSRYQTVFAKNAGSIAAPTASLHFTRPLLRRLERAGITIARVTLHVHLGTFAPLTEEQWKTGRLHAEHYSIDKKTTRLIQQAKREGRPIIAAGTTVMRALESAADARGRIARPRGITRLFIREGYRFRVIDGLLTNFHVPRSSLLMLVCAFAGREKILELYRAAIKRKFRLFSFGDAMLLLP